MERRKALAVAGTIVGTLAAAGAAMAVNFGLLGAQASTVGNLDVKGAALLARPATPPTTEPTPDVTIIYQDIPVPTGAASSSGGSSAGSGGGSSSAGSGGGYVGAPAPTVAATPAATTPAGSDDHGDDSHDVSEPPERPDDDD